MNMFICQASTNSQILGILSSLPSRGGGGRTNPKIVAMQEWFSKNVFGTCPNLVVPEVVKESVIGCEGGKRTKELFVRLLNSILTVMVVEAVEKGSNVLLLGLNFGGKKAFWFFFCFFVVLSMQGNHRTCLDNVSMCDKWIPERFREEFARGSEASSWDFEAATRSGVSVATCYCGDIQLDSADLEEGIMETYEM